MRRSSSAPNTSERERPGHARRSHQRDADDLADDGDVVRMTQEPVRARTAIAVDTGHDDDAERPGRSERRDRPPLERLRGGEDRQARDEPALASGTPRERAFGEHREKTPGYAICINA